MLDLENARRLAKLVELDAGDVEHGLVELDAGDVEHGLVELDAGDVNCPILVRGVRCDPDGSPSSSGCAYSYCPFVGNYDRSRPPP